ncbi:hypothetical protein PAPYR_11547 [Paratrimastix pyriformis]|uniref:Uncharacterized protein n=1 Tax=Paratrimastix pyriformis TaxID=342808 RepID=A0ABQ8U6B2_9EUKA|nr:hypothetical protein PAPYR_11547 [Paratrimastix pyriformis]
MVCRLGVVAALGGGCPQVGVVCLADVSLSPGWTECFASEVGPRLILRISDIWPLRCLNVAADSVKAGQGQSGYCFELSWNGVDGSSNACICTKPPNEWATLDDV